MKSGRLPHRSVNEVFRSDARGYRETRLPDHMCFKSAGMNLQILVLLRPTRVLK